MSGNLTAGSYLGRSAKQLLNDHLKWWVIWNRVSCPTPCLYPLSTTLLPLGATGSSDPRGKSSLRWRFVEIALTLTRTLWRAIPGNPVQGTQASLLGQHDQLGGPWARHLASLNSQEGLREDELQDHFPPSQAMSLWIPRSLISLAGMAKRIRSLEEQDLAGWAGCGTWMPVLCHRWRGEDRSAEEQYVLCVIHRNRLRKYGVWWSRPQIHFQWPVGAVPLYAPSSEEAKNSNPLFYRWLDSVR